MVRLGEVAEFQQGGTPPKNRDEYWDGDIPFVTGADLREVRINRDNARSFLTAEGLRSGATYSPTGQAYPAVRPNDVAAYLFGLPTLPEQRAIAELLDSVDEAIDRTRAERDGLQLLKEATTGALLTG